MALTPYQQRRRRMMRYQYMAAAAAAAASDTYAVGGNSPDVVADFASATEYFRVGGTASDFETMFDVGTTTAYPTSLGTMVDSDGLLKWGPHNLVPRSDNFTSWTYIGTATVSADATTTPTGVANSADTFTVSSTTITSASRGYGSITHTLGSNIVFWAKAGTADIACYSTASGTGPWAYFNLTSVTVPFSNACTASITDAGNGWYKCTLANITNSGGNRSFLIAATGATNADPWSGATVTNGSTMSFWGAHIYRSDLNGMVDVPTDQRVAAGSAFATYVPTTTAARYLHRRGNHVYNGSSWVKKGILIETEARTNIQLNSNTFSSWTSTNSATVTQNLTGPDGVANSAWTMQDPGTGTNYFGVTTNTGTQFTVTSGTTYTATLWVKYIDAQYIQATYGSTFHGSTQYATFDILNKTVNASAGTGVTAYVVDEGDWLRLVYSAPATGSGTQGIFWIFTGATGRISTYAADGRSCGIYGGQVEAGSTPSSYIPTSGATVTRTADSLVIPAANMSYSATAMSFQMDGTVDVPSDSSDRLWSWTSSSSNRIISFIATNSASGTILATSSGTQDTASLVDLLSSNSGKNLDFNFAARITTSELNGAVSGTAGTANTTLTSIANLSSTSFDFGSTGGANQNNGMNIGQFRQWDVDLGDSGLETATS